MRQLDVAVLILEHETARALQHAGAAARKARRVLARPDAASASLHADQPRRTVSATKASKIPMALLPPPTHATIGVGQRARTARDTAPAPRGR